MAHVRPKRGDYVTRNLLSSDPNHRAPPHRDRSLCRCKLPRSLRTEYHRMSKDEGQSRGVSAAADHQPQYGTFQGVANYPPPPQPPPPHQAAFGFPQPAPPPGATHDPSAPPPYQGYQAVPGYPVAEGRPVRERRLPCCGLGLGWCLFIIGFFLGGIPWYVGLCFMVFCRHRMDYREKPGYITCTIAAVLETIALIFGVAKGVNDR
ncbi:hypothetical protein EUGRSUZ_F03217 [Eucalyptus grandis]|uniref:Uncharacterized protein n=2 Tax=Eucalyptus grandis TaxID=71139 RepID=A0ACC3KLJ9_EUCGR|nr:hypothetical protein EUGRSUZ_F03217 [Eucalyptus grandis]